LNVNRRDFLALGAVALARPVLTRPALARPGSGEVVIATSGGLLEDSLRDHFYRRFEDETGLRVRSVAIELPEQWARVMAGRREGAIPFDVVTATPPDLIEHAGLLAPVDCGTAPMRLQALGAGCLPRGIVRTVGGLVVAHRREAFPGGGPHSWADFFDVARFPGPRALPDTGDRDWWVPAAALLAEGVTREALFPLDLRRAYRKLDALRPHVAAWWSSGEDAARIMHDGEAAAAMLPSSRAVPLIRTGAYEIAWNGALRDVRHWAVLKDGPNAANGPRFLDFFVQNPRAHLAFNEAVSLDSNNRESTALVPSAERRYRPSWPGNGETMVIADDQWIAAHRDALRARWAEWRGL